MLVNTLITAAGNSTKIFLEAGFKSPKNLILVEGYPVVLRAVKSYAFDISRTTLVINEGENAEWHTNSIIKEISPQLEIVNVKENSKGALISAMLGVEKIDLSLPLIITSGDSELLIDTKLIYEKFFSKDIDAGTIVFPSSNPRYSYISVGSQNKVKQIAEKKIIGPLATTGVFYFKKGIDFWEASRWSILNKQVVGDNYFVSSTLNYMIQMGKNVEYETIEPVEYKSWSLPVDFWNKNESL